MKKSHTYNYIPVFAVIISVFIFSLWIGTPEFYSMNINDNLGLSLFAIALTTFWFLMIIISYPMWRTVDLDALAKLLARQFLDEGFKVEFCLAEDFKTIENIFEKVRSLKDQGIPEEHRSKIASLLLTLNHSGISNRHNVEEYLYDAILIRLKGSDPAHFSPFTSQEKRMSNIFYLSSGIKRHILTEPFYIRWQSDMAEIYRLEKELKDILKPKVYISPGVKETTC